MRRAAICGTLLAALLAAGCGVRPPVTVAPAYPDYLYPHVPEELLGTDAARRLDDAWAVLQAGDLAAAEQLYAALVDTDPALYPAHTGLGWLQFARGDAAAAAAAFGRALAAAADYVPALVGSGESLLALEDVAAAIDAFEHAAALDPDLSELRRTAADLRFTLTSQRIAAARESTAAGRLAEARADYEALVAASPESAFLHLELGAVQRRLGDVAAALASAQRAIDLDPFDPVGFRLAGELHEAAGDLEAAIAAFERLDSLEPGDDTSRRLERLREQVRLASLPPIVQQIRARDVVTRGELAALIGTFFDDLLAAAAGERQTVIMTDAREHRHRKWILEVVRAGVMALDAAYRFDPERTVRRADLAETVGALLDLAAARDPAAGARWAAGRPNFGDMPATHLSYLAAARAVTAGVLAPLDGGEFQPTRLVDGAAAVGAVERLAELLGTSD